MFYSHEILTSRRYGVATIWLVATLGSKSGLKKVTRKAIQDVDLPSACSTIIDPEAPMALRLQGSLLYGVSRVYSQQCGYVLADAQAIRDKMHQAIAVIRAAKDTGLDPKAGKARPEQLNIPEDATFLPDIALSFDLSDLEDFDLPQSSLISLDAFLASSLPHDNSPMLDIGSASTQSGLDGFGGFGIGDTSSVQKLGSRTSHISLLDNPNQLLDTGLVLDDDFNIVDAIDHAGLDDQQMGEGMFEEARDDRAGTLPLPGDAGQTPVPLAELMDLDEGIMAFGDDDQLPVRASPRVLDELVVRSTASATEEIVETSSTAEAPQRRQRVPRTIQVEDFPQLPNDVLRAWSDNYLRNMQLASHIKQQHRNVFVAKKNAAFFVCGTGIGGVGSGIGLDKVVGPLSHFSGQQLLEALLGSPSHKRARSASPGSAAAGGRRVRTRSNEDHAANDEALPSVEDGERGRPVPAELLADDSGIMGLGDDDIEMGREAPPSLPDARSSLPWNLSSSRFGSGPFGSAVLRRTSSLIGSRGGMDPAPFPGHSRRGSRMMSSSPLGGKGVSIGRLSQLEIPSHGVSISDDGFDAELRSPSIASGNFPRIPVDSQAVIAALDNESHNFLAFVAADIDAANEDRDDEEEDGEILFSKLLPPEAHSRDVAAQAFLHVLTLATKGLINVEQQEEEDDIHISVVAET